MSEDASDVTATTTARGAGSHALARGEAAVKDCDGMIPMDRAARSSNLFCAMSTFPCGARQPEHASTMAESRSELL